MIDAYYNELQQSILRHLQRTIDARDIARRGSPRHTAYMFNAHALAWLLICLPAFLQGWAQLSNPKEAQS